MKSSDIIVEGLAYTVMGILIVFLILVIIMLVIKAMSLFGEEKKLPEETPVQPQQTTLKQTGGDEELIAVISAAVALVMDKAASDIVVRSYKKLPADAWKSTGRKELLENRF